MDNSKLTLLKELHSQGKSNREIGRQLGLHHNTIAYHLKKLGLQSNTANQSIDLVSDHEARCKKCKEIKSINEFQFGRKGQKYEYKFSYCNECRKKQTYLNLNSEIEKFLKDKYNRLVNRSKKLNIICSISIEDFIKQYKIQNGKCFYTDEPMICKVGEGKQRNSLSIDKIIAEKGYIKDNVVFCTNQMNTCKSDLSLDQLKKIMPSCYYRIINKLNRDKIEDLLFCGVITEENLFGNFMAGFTSCNKIQSLLNFLSLNRYVDNPITESRNIFVIFFYLVSEIHEFQNYVKLISDEVYQKFPALQTDAKELSQFSGNVRKHKIVNVIRNNIGYHSGYSKDYVNFYKDLVNKDGYFTLASHIENGSINDTIFKTMEPFLATEFGSFANNQHSTLLDTIHQEFAGNMRIKFEELFFKVYSNNLRRV